MNTLSAKLKRNVRNLTHYYIRKGKIKRRPCDACRTTIKVEAHHVSYDNPFAIRWLCRPCHVDAHLDLRYPNAIRKQLGLF